MNECCYFDGRIVPVDQLVLRADDSGFQLGLSIFDTVLFEAGCFYFLETHLERLRRGAEELSIPWPLVQDPVQALSMLAGAIEAETLALRMTLSRGPAGGPPTFIITAREVPDLPERGVVLQLARDRRVAGDPMGRLKSTNRLLYVLAREEATRHGAWEALFVSTDGDVLEGTISNFFCVLNGELATPSVSRGCLPGILRHILLENLERVPLELEGRAIGLRVDRVQEAELDRVSEVFLTNTTGRVIPVCELRGLGAGQNGVRELPGADGPVTRAVAERVGALESSYRAEQREKGIRAQIGRAGGR